MYKQQKDFIPIMSVLTFVYLILDQFNQRKDQKLEYVCRHFSDHLNHPIKCYGWIISVSVMSFIVSFNSKVGPRIAIITLLLFLSLVLFANMDYETRTDSRKPSIYSTPHYMFTLATFFMLLLLLYLVYGKVMTIPLVVIFGTFLTLHMLGIKSLENRKKYLKYSVKLELFIIYSIILLLLVDTNRELLSK